MNDTQGVTSLLPCVAVIRPFSMSCPSMLRMDNEYLYPKVLKELLRQKVFSDIVISVSPDTPEEMLDVISSWGFEYDVGEHFLPQLRVSDLASRKGWKTVCCISSYTYFFDREVIADLAAEVTSGRCDFAGDRNALSNMEFCIVNRRTLDFFNTIDDRAVIPSKPQAVERNADESLVGCMREDFHTLSERFLWLSTYVGDIGTMPTDFTLGFYGETKPEAWFQRSLREAWGLDYFNVRNIDWIDDLLRDKFIPAIDLDKLVGQIRWSQRFEDELKHQGGLFLELGFGEIPLLSFMLRSQFREVVALEPFASFQFDEQAVVDLIDSLPDALGREQQSLPENQEVIKNMAVLDKSLEDVQLDSQSVDFCVSKMVFEHVEDVSALSQELHRVLKPGGVMLHEIGLNDHTCGTSSGIHFAFLSQSRKQWCTPWNGTNLWRINDFVQLWESMGFKVNIVQKVVSRNKPPAIHESWSSYSLEDLLCQVAVIRAVKQ